MAREKPPELTFQQHVADFLVREHRYGGLEQSDVTDTEHCIAKDQLWAFPADLHGSMRTAPTRRSADVARTFTQQGYWPGSAR
jgi:hypothetical protein